MAIISVDTFQSYPASIASLSDANDYILALDANLELLRVYGYGTAATSLMLTTAKAVKDDDISGSYDTTDSPISGAATDEKNILDSSAGNVTYNLDSGTYENGHIVKFLRTSASNVVTIGRNGHNINGVGSDFTVSATANLYVVLEYWGTSYGFTATELS